MPEEDGAPAIGHERHRGQHALDALLDQLVRTGAAAPRLPLLHPAPAASAPRLAQPPHSGRGVSGLVRQQRQRHPPSRSPDHLRDRDRIAGAEQRRPACCPGAAGPGPAAGRRPGGSRGCPRRPRTQGCADAGRRRPPPPRCSGGPGPARGRRSATRDFWSRSPNASTRQARVPGAARGLGEGARRDAHDQHRAGASAHLRTSSAPVTYSSSRTVPRASRRRITSDQLPVTASRQAVGDQGGAPGGLLHRPRRRRGTAPAPGATGRRRRARGSRRMRESRPESRISRGGEATASSPATALTRLSTKASLASARRPRPGARRAPPAVSVGARRRRRPLRRRRRSPWSRRPSRQATSASRAPHAR